MALIPIYTKDEFEAISAAASWTGNVYRLMVNIFGQGDTIDPIGTLPTQFDGTLEINGFKIKNYVLNAADDFIGLIGFTTGGTILGQGGSIENISATGEIGVGALAGLANAATISDILVKNCTVTGTTLVGGAFGTTSSSASDVDKLYCINNTVLATDAAGGVGGVSGADTAPTTYNDCGSIGGTATASHGASVNAGNFVGKAGGRYVNCIASGTAIANSDYGVFCGLDFTGSYTNCFYNSDDGSDTCATALTTDEMQQEGSFTGWDFQSTWVMVKWDRRANGRHNPHGVSRGQQILYPRLRSLQTFGGR